jgi:hypothetical protein
MNAPTIKRHLLPQSAKAIGDLLYSGYQFSDCLYLDLYGSRSDTGGYCVETASVCGTMTSLHDLLTADELNKMSDWLDTEIH